MALKSCVNCGREYSDTVEQCPHCQYKATVCICSECGRFCGKDDKFCMYCGIQLSNINKTDAPKEKIQEELQAILKRLKDDFTKEEQKIMLRNLNLFESTGEYGELVTECKKVLKEKEEQIEKKEEYNKICESINSLDSSKKCKECIDKLKKLSGIFDVDESISNFALV